MLPIFAEGGGPPAEYMGYFIAAILTLLGGAVAIKELISKRADKEAVPRKEFDELKHTVSAQSTSINIMTTKLTEYATRTELIAIRTELSTQLEKIDQYSRSRNHKLAEKVNELQLSIEALHRNIQSEMSSIMDKVMERLERTSNAVVEMRAMMDRRLPKDDKQE